MENKASAMEYEEYILAHKAEVITNLYLLIGELESKAFLHDESKLGNRFEYDMFKAIHDKVAQISFGSPEYDEILKGMGEPLQEHYRNNRHHPEHFPNGVSGMNLLDVMEMLCDWIAAADMKGTPVSMEYLQNRFNISDQLASILGNTIQFLQTAKTENLEREENS